MVRKVFRVSAVGQGGKAEEARGGVTRKDIKKRQGVSVDEALQLAGFGKFNGLMLMYCGCLMLGMILETLGFSYVLPAARCDLRLTLDAQGWLAAIPFAGFIVTSHAWGWLADTRGRRYALLLSTSVGAGFSLLSSLAPEFWSFVVLRFCAALFISGGAALGYAFLGEFSPAQHRDKMVALANASVALGTAVVPLVAWAVLPADFTWWFPFGGGYRPWRLLVCCLAAPYVLCAAAGARVPESPKFLAARGRTHDALHVLAGIYALNTGRPAEEYEVASLAEEVTGSVVAPSLRSMFTQTAAMFRGPLLRYSLLLGFLQFVSFAVSNGFYIWLPGVVNQVWSSETRPGTTNLCGMLTLINNKTVPSLKEEECDDSIRTEAFVMTIAIASFITAFTVVVAFSVKRLGKKPILAAIFCVAAVCSLALHWTTDTLTSLLFFCSFQLCSTTIGLVNAFVVQIYPTQLRAMAVCVAMLFGRAGSMLFSKGVGTLLQLYCPACFFISAALLAMSAGLTVLLPEDKTPPPPASRAPGGDGGVCGGCAAVSAVSGGRGVDAARDVSGCGGGDVA